MSVIRKCNSYDGIIVDGETGWYILSGTNILAEINISTGKLKICGVVPSVHEYGVQYRFLLKVNSKLLILPYFEKKIYIYDISLSKFFEYNVQIDVPEKYGDWLLTGGLTIGETIILYGMNPFLIRIEDDKSKIIEINNHINVQLLKGRCFWNYSKIAEDTVYLIATGHPYIIKYNMSDDMISLIKLKGVGSDDYLGHPIYEDGFVYYSKSSDDRWIIYREQTENGRIESASLGDTIKPTGKITSFMGIFDDQLWLLPSVFSKCVKVDLVTMHATCMEGFPEVDSSELKNVSPYEYHCRGGVMDNKGHIISIHQWTNCIVDIDTSGGMIHTVPIEDKDADVVKLMFESYGGMVEEYNTKSLEGLLSYVKQ